MNASPQSTPRLDARTTGAERVLPNAAASARRRALWNLLEAVLYLSPSLLIFITFVFVPLIRTFWLSGYATDPLALLSVDYFRRVDLNQPALAVNEVQATGASLIGVNKDLLTPPLIAEAHRRGLKVEVWTVDNPDEMSKFIDLNVDGITTNRPDLLKSLLAFDPFVTRVTLVPEWLHRFRL